MSQFMYFLTREYESKLKELDTIKLKKKCIDSEFEKLLVIVEGLKNSLERFEKEDQQK